MTDKIAQATLQDQAIPQDGPDRLGEGVPQGARVAPDSDARALSLSSASSPQPPLPLASPPLARSYPVGFIRQYELVDRVKAYDPRADEDLLNQAYVFSMMAHGSQTRKNGDPYYTHPISVAAILTDLKADPATIVTALLHDTVEDTDATVDDIRGKFGDEVARLVDGVTKLSKMEINAEATQQAENFRKFVFAMARDVRVLLVKLADRLHNMRTLHYIPQQEKRRRIARETMEIYAPLAGRIGVQRFREELEDLAFRFLNPEGFESIETRLEALRKKEVHGIVSMSVAIRDSLGAEGIKAEVHSREKRPFSIWAKMRRKGHAFEELADIYAFRILVETPGACYRALGAIHQTFRMIPDEFDDYISSPKPNNYQSIHTAVLAPTAGKSGQRVEVQIRTHAMHETADRGIAAHWKYKDAAADIDKAASVIIEKTAIHDPYEWARNAVEMLQSGDDPREFLEYAKMDLFQDQVFCFTPKGRVIALPSEATAIDFAYALHTDVGDECAGIKINGMTRPLRTAIKNGDVVEILRSKDATIPRGWENSAITGRAKSAIRRRIKKLKARDQQKFGKRILEAEFAGHDFELTSQAIERALDTLEKPSVEAVYRAVGALDLTAHDVREAVYPGAKQWAARLTPKRWRRRREGNPAGIAIDGLHSGVLVKFAECCSPLPGERIIGLADGAMGVDIHRIDCDEIEATEIPADDWLDLRWRSDLGTNFVAQIKLTLKNQTGALGKVATMLGHYQADIVDIRLRNREVDFTEMLIDISVNDARHFSNVLTGLRTVEGVLSATREADRILARGRKRESAGIRQGRIP